MPTLTIRNVPHELHETLKDRARKNRRSVNQEVIAELSDVAGYDDHGSKRNRALQMISLAGSLRGELQRTLSVGEIQAAIEDGRG